MSVVSRIVNKGTVKLVAALAIPVGIAWAFIYSAHQADVEVTNFKREQQANPTTDRVSVNNYELKEVDDSNQIRWQLIAKQGVVDPTSQIVSLKDIKVDYFKEGKLNMRLSAPHGLANESKRYVKLEGDASQAVVAYGQEGKARLEAKVVELSKKNQFTASGGVNIVSEVAKVTGSSAIGTIDASGLKDFKVVGNTRTEIAVK